MSELNSPEERLAELEQRWQAENSPSLFLPLVEEYRHLGRSEDALRVLETGLSSHPGHLSALVAKARCLLDLGRADEALKPLEEVMRQDGTHMVAAKLLVEAHLRRGDTVQARRRLELYEEISPADPDAAELRKRIAGLQLEDAAAAGSAPASDLGAGARASEKPAPPVIHLARSARDQPFDLLGNQSRYRQAWGEGEVFAWIPAGSELVPDSDSDSDSASGSDSAPEPFPGLDAPPAQVAAEDGPFAVGVLSPSVVDSGGTQEIPRLAAGSERVPPATGATATLGRLYLSQGHEEEAERIFRLVLEQDPTNPVALEGLAELDARTGSESVESPAETAGFAAARASLPGPIPAHDLAAHLVGDLPSEATPTLRKVRLLQRYLGLLRTGETRDHVS